MLLAKGKCTEVRATSLPSSFAPDRVLVFPPQRTSLGDCEEMPSKILTSQGMKTSGKRVTMGGSHSECP